MDRVLFVTSEAYPVIKTGGLADYSGGLTKALRRRGVDVRVLLPCYPGTVDRLIGPLARIELGDAFGVGPVSLVSGRMPESDAPAWLIDCPMLYLRRGGIYQDANGDDWPDNGMRFGLLARVAASLALGRTPIGWRCDLVHLNEWQTGPAAALLAHAAGAPPSLFTIHNMAFQGLFERSVLEFLELPQAVFDAGDVEFFGRVSYLKAGLRYAQRIATVSEAYAQEIQTPDYGFGLDGLLRERAADLVGILNGADYEDWDPRTDPQIAARFDAADLRGKAACASALRQRVGLPATPEERPLFAYVSRMTHQKMTDVLIEAIPQLQARGAQLVVLGQGDHRIEHALQELAQRYPHTLAVTIGYDESLAHQLLAGADILLAPARFEPCGLTQMYGLRYGAVPIVTRVGGLRETVIDAQPQTLADGTATGFVFDDRSLGGLLAAIDRALALRGDYAAWSALQRNGMSVDFSWRRSAQRYEQVYRALLAARSSRRDSAPQPSAAKPEAAAAVPGRARPDLLIH